MPPRKPVKERTDKHGPADRIPIGIRVPARDLEEIHRRADAAGLSLSEYMIRCALGKPVDSQSLEQRVDEIEASFDERLRRLERYVELGS